ncbi:PHP domain-containing protein [Nakamurella lactea]|uniref:PHP domain-containing protein n=1 Tax=Nakamurella lactea TaxID=459515 RepID=UPI0004270FC2|nr:PHP domain-containing protein [Nakamurella lactea]
MRIDLHTHSAASDGTDTPAELMRAAAASGLDVVAITDHDTTDGWAPALAARPAGLTVIRGAEFSTAVPIGARRVSVHLLGYLFDPDDPAIVAEHQRLRAERLQRGLAIVDLMVADGIGISRQQVLDIAAGAPVGRPHIGRALVRAGVVDSVTEAFSSYLAGHGSYYVPKLDTDLRVAVQLVTAAGGAAVIAHPRGRGEFRALTAELIGELADLGLAGLEVDHPDHDAADRAELTEIAQRFSLLRTGSSDYHGHNKSLTLGQCTTAPEALQRLISRTSGATGPIGGSA